MKLYIAKIKLQISRYMVDDDEVKEITTIVRADDKSQAGVKIINHFDDKTEQYSIYYRVIDMELEEEIT